MKFLIINGPNLNLLGKREPEIYGSRSFEDFLIELKDRFSDIQIDYFQTNHEGLIIDKLQEADGVYTGVVLNAAGYTHTSIAIGDTIKAVGTPVVEVHISDVYEREEYRRNSYVSPVAYEVIIGKGLEGYAMALESLLKFFQ